jgi:hypothetical protein
VSHQFKQGHLSLSLDDLVCLLLLGIQSRRCLGVARELPRIVVESRDVCIALLSVGIHNEHRIGPGGNLGGLGLKET